MQRALFTLCYCENNNSNFNSLYFLFIISAEEKPKLPSGKNGAQISEIHQMPTLDPEPEQKEQKEAKVTEDDKTCEGDNGKILNKDKEDNADDSGEKGICK